VTGLRTWLHTATDNTHTLTDYYPPDTRTGAALLDAALALALLDATITVLDNAVLQGRDLPATILSAALDDLYTRHAPTSPA
jgi:hypothetical protein